MQKAGWLVGRKTGGGTGDGYNRSVLPLLLQGTITFMRTSSNVQLHSEYIIMGVL